MAQMKEKLGNSLYEIVHKKPEGTFSFFINIFLAMLEFLSYIYCALAWTKRSLYQYGLLKSHKLSCPVISLGNITLGGTGKTPTAKKLAYLIRDMGFKTAVLNRGYKASFKGEAALVSDGEKIYMDVCEAGDEAYLLAKSMPGVMVIIGADRAAAGEFAIKKHGAEVIIIDDGYQHWKLKRDMDIVLIDALNPFGNRHTLPRGTLREPLSSLNRADVFLLTKTNQAAKDIKDAIRDELFEYNKKALIVNSSHAAGEFIEIEEWLKLSNGGKKQKETLEEKEPVDFTSDKLIAFSALGNPASFEQTLNSLGVKTAEFICYQDHHKYTSAEMFHVQQKAVAINAKALVTTEKDAVKIPEEFLQNKEMPLYVLPIEVVFHEGYEELVDVIKNMLKNKNMGEN
jgi:tetraacyldisaccharide 4'-kinase